MPPKLAVAAALVFEPTTLFGQANVNGPADVGVMPIETNEFVHVIEFVTALMVAAGAPNDDTTCTVEDIVQPVIGLIAINVYVAAAPAVVVKLFGVLTPPNQFAIAVLGLALPFSVTVGTPHINVCVKPALTAAGAVIFCMALIVVE
jgi:hypothetical protein